MTWPIFFLVGFALLMVGIFGGQMLPSLLGDQQDVTQEFNVGDVDRRTERVAPQEEVRPTPAEAGTDSGSDAPATGEASGPGDGETDAPPGAGAQLDALMERIAADRQWREERRKLAADSPLTPGIEDMADLVRRGRFPDAGSEPARSTGPADALVPDTGLRGGTSSAGMEPAPERASGYLLARGSVIPAVLQTPLDSDLPGLVRAQVSEDVRDSASGRHVLIPRGAQLVGRYGSDARTGQRRLFVTWTDLRLPETEETLALDQYSTLGADGASGVRGRRSTNLLAALGAAVLFDLAGNATAILTDTETSSGNEGDLGALIAAATGNATGRVAEHYLGDLLSRGPRFRVRAGTHMNVLVEADMRLPAREISR